MINYDKKVWSQQEDTQIINLVKEFGNKKWTLIAKRLKEIIAQTERTGKQIRQRWHNHLNPQINKKSWSLQEQMKLLQLQKAHGNKWSRISKFMTGRTDNCIKNHFYSTLRRSLRWINKQLFKKRISLHSQIKSIKFQLLSQIVAVAVGDENVPWGFQYSKEQAQNIVDHLYQIGVKKPRNLLSQNQYNNLCFVTVRYILSLKQQIQPIRSNQFQEASEQQAIQPIPNLTTKVENQQIQKIEKSPEITQQPTHQIKILPQVEVPNHDNQQDKIKQQQQPIQANKQQNYQLSDCYSVISYVNSPLSPCDFTYGFTLSAAQFLFTNQLLPSFIHVEGNNQQERH